MVQHKSRVDFFRLGDFIRVRFRFTSVSGLTKMESITMFFYIVARLSSYLPVLLIGLEYSVAIDLTCETGQVFAFLHALSSSKKKKMVITLIQLLF